MSLGSFVVVRFGPKVGTTPAVPIRKIIWRRLAERPVDISEREHEQSPG